MMSLFDALGGGNPAPGMLPGFNNMQNLINQFQKFKQTFTGNPQQQVQQLLSSGKISQSQYNQAVQITQQLQKLLK